MEAGKVFGEVPFPLLFLPNANQTYAYQRLAFNMMNFMEFVSDEYVSINIQQYFFGFFFNRIPLFKKLKLREVVSFKLLWGRLTDGNDPNLNEELIKFPTFEDGSPSTFSLEEKPYIEGSIGVSNIFKLLRVDFVKRMTYLDHPFVPNLFGVKGLGIRARARIEF
jgi:hypothetical protein